MARSPGTSENWTAPKAGPAWLAWLCFALLVLMAGCGVALGVRIWRSLATGNGARGFASGSDLANQLSVRFARRHASKTRSKLDGGGDDDLIRVHLGASARPRARSVDMPRDNTIYGVAPTQSGKTSRLVIGLALDAPGAVVVTSTKSEVYHLTAGARRRRGPVAVFDTLSIAGAPEADRLRWSLVQGCEDPAVAQRRASAICDATGGAEGVKDSAFWEGNALTVLSCYLHAAAVADLGMAEIRDWSLRPSVPRPVEILRRSVVPGWADELKAQVDLPEETQGGVWATVRSLLSCLRSPDTLDTVTPRPGVSAFDAEDFIRADGTLYVVARRARQNSKSDPGPTGLATALVDELLTAARRLAETEGDTAGHLEPPMSVVLEEWFNTCPTPLDGLFSDCLGSGITATAILQAHQQAVSMLGEARARVALQNATCLLTFGGGNDDNWADMISRLCGEYERLRMTTTTGSGSHSTSRGLERTRVVPPEEVLRMDTRTTGEALLLYRTLRPVLVKLQPWWERPDAHELVAANEASRRRASEASHTRRAEFARQVTEIRAGLNDDREAR